MTKPSEISELIADVREQILYAQELGIELLKADVSTPHAVETQSEPTIPQIIGEPPVVLPRVEMPKVAEKKPSRLSALPSLTNRTQYTSQNGPTDDVRKNVERQEEKT